MNTKVIPEIRIALFGQSGSGKTTFLASYYGNQQRNSFEENKGYTLEADDISDGNQLLSRYYQMEDGKFPQGTDKFSEYKFNFKITGINRTGMNIVWYDYPGGWWERTPMDPSEAQARSSALNKIMGSQIGIILIDGQKYLKDGLPYVRALLDGLKNEIRRISSSPENAGVGSLPTQWFIAISKADLLSKETTAETICKSILKGAADQLQGVAKSVNSKSFGHQFLLVSSAAADGSKVIDVHRFIGLQLIAPLSLLSILSEFVEKADNGKIYGALENILKAVSGIVDIIDKLDDMLPPKYQILTGILRALSLKEGLGKGTQYFKEKQSEAAKRGRLLDAIAAAMQAELASPAAQHAFFRNQ